MIQLDSFIPGEIAVVSPQVDLWTIEVDIRVVDYEGGVDGSVDIDDL